MATTVVETARGDGWVGVSFDQSAAEAGDLVAAPGAGFRIVVKNFTCTAAAAGTVQLKTGTTNLTGAMPTGVGIPVEFDDVHCAKNEKFAVTSTVSALKGYFAYEIR